MSANGMLGGAISFSLFAGTIGGLLGGLISAIAASILGGIIGGGIGMATYDMFLRCWMRITGPPTKTTLASSGVASEGKYVDSAVDGKD